MPFGVIQSGLLDRTVRACARLIMEPSATRDRLTEDVYIGNEAVARLETAFRLVLETLPIQRLLSEAERNRLEAADVAVAEVVTVDDFASEEFRRFTTSSHKRQT